MELTLSTFPKFFLSFNTRYSSDTESDDRSFFASRLERGEPGPVSCSHPVFGPAVIARLERGSQVLECLPLPEREEAGLDVIFIKDIQDGDLVGKCAWDGRFCPPH